MSDELQPDERRMADLFRQVEAPASMRRWDVRADGAARRRRWWTRAFLALFSAGGERRLRPLAAALVLPVLVLAVGGGLQLRAHFSGGGSGSAVNPPARSNAAMAFDAARSQVVLFGGRGADGQVLGDTWTWDGGSWTQQRPALSPSARWDATMAFDAAHGVVVLYGGREASLGPTASRDTWTWDGSNWHQVTTAHRPTGLGEMAYDAKRNQVILIVQSNFHALTAAPPPAALDPGTGGPVATSPVTTTLLSTQVETWTWTGSDWKQLAPHTTPSGPPNFGSLAWDDAIQRLTLITSDIGGPTCAAGGEQVSTMFGEAQAQASAAAGAAAGAHGSAGWSGYSSAPYPPSPPPSPLPTPRAAQIVPAPRVMVTPPIPPQLVRPCMATPENSLGSASSGLHCADCPLAHQWTWDGSNWSETRLGSNVSFGGQTLVNDPSSGRPIAVDASRTWTWNGSKWALHLNPDGLKQRHGMSLAADTAHHVVVLFGGLAGATLAGDTWTWDGKAWTHAAGAVPQLQTTFEPPVAIAPQAPPQGACAGPQLDVSYDGSGGVQIAFNRPPADCLKPADGTISLVNPAGASLAVTGNGVNVGTQQFVLLRWTNWCATDAGTVEVRAPNLTTTTVLHAFPTCTDRSKPSLLTVVPTHTVTTP